VTNHYVRGPGQRFATAKYQALLFIDTVGPGKRLLCRNFGRESLLVPARTLRRSSNRVYAVPAVFATSVRPTWVNHRVAGRLRFAGDRIQSAVSRSRTAVQPVQAVWLQVVHEL
jgi:hypothetical protein